MIGQIVSHYRIVRKLGAGGMGEVYEAEDLKLGRHVAVKFLPEALSSDRSALDRFQREARAASALNHANICTVYDIDEAGRRNFIAMELLQGQTLEQRLTSGPLPTEQLLEIALEIARALQVAHDKGNRSPRHQASEHLCYARRTCEGVGFWLSEAASGANISVRGQPRRGRHD